MRALNLRIATYALVRRNGPLMTLLAETLVLDDYYTAKRDSKGGIRLSNGTGLLVADADHTIADVQGWLNTATNERYKAQYRAALKLMLNEAFSALAA